MELNMDDLIKIGYADSNYVVVDKISLHLKIHGLMIEECDSDPSDGQIIYRIVKIINEN
jgi:hypothetical protein